MTYQFREFRMDALAPKVLDGEIKKQEPGIFSAPLEVASALMPDLRHVFDSCPIDEFTGDWTIDVRVHMLMKGSYPCIPGVHCDFVPRDDNGVRYDLLPWDEKPMFMLVYGDPAPVFPSGQMVHGEVPSSHSDVSVGTDLVEAEQGRWIRFWRRTPHAGMPSQENGAWRLFIRVAPREYQPVASPQFWKRRHSQVYLNASDFSW